ncbi:tetraspanin-8-like [Archocentrus centrarchus]|uniref:tetraspanin-8-like n=1 Tax=Archocentrus centrarchus TaxID=63155 RepID=UPI0011E9BD68|nr:tetraspanin-8-like [Archocentrus centrarchus]
MAVNKCVKYLLFFFNLLFWLSGCLILGVSIYLKVSKNANQITNEALPGIDLMIAIGVIIMVLGFLGCCGAIRENRCMLLLFFIFLLLIFILLVAAGIAGAVSQNKMNEWVDQRLQNLTATFKQDQTLREDIQKLQKELKCCGLLNGKSDWAPEPIPTSCRCNVTATNTNECGSDGNYSTPCATQVINLMKANMKIVLGIAFAIAVLLIFGMVFSMMLYCQIGRKDGATANA